jgi:hypothetical protein
VKNKKNMKIYFNIYFLKINFKKHIASHYWTHNFILFQEDIEILSWWGEFSFDL